MPLSTEQREHINNAVASVESRTGTQIVVAVVPKSDSYPELPWKAFACATALAALAVVVSDTWRPDWWMSAAPMFAVHIVLGVGVAAALAAVFIAPFGRLFLRGTRAETEARLRAQSLFLERELFAPRERSAVLLLISEFERQFVILPDSGIRAKVPEAAWQSVVTAMRDSLAKGDYVEAIEAGLLAVAFVLDAHGFSTAKESVDELPNLIEAQGAQA